MPLFRKADGKEEKMRKIILLAVLFSFNMGASANAAIPLPTGPQVFSTLPSDKPGIKSDPAAAHPLGIGPLSAGDNTLRLQIGFDEFEAPVDIIVGIAVPSPVNDVLIIRPDLSVQSISSGLTAWKSSTKGPVNETIWGNIDSSLLPEGDYTVYVLVIPAGGLSPSSVAALIRSPAGPPEYRLPAFYIYANPFVVVKSKIAKLEYSLRCTVSYGWELSLIEEGSVPFGIKNGNRVGGIGGGDVTYTIASINGCVADGTGFISMIFSGVVEETQTGYVLRITDLHGEIDYNTGQMTCPYIGTLPFDPGTLQIGTFLFPGLEDSIIPLHLTPPDLGERFVSFTVPPASCSGEISVNTN